MYCNEKFANIFILFLLVNMCICVVSEASNRDKKTEDKGFTNKKLNKQQHPWYSHSQKDSKLEKKQQLSKDGHDKDATKELEALSGNLYDVFKKRLDIIQKELTYHKVSMDEESQSPNELVEQQAPIYDSTFEFNMNVLQPDKEQKVTKRSSIKDKFSEEYKKKIDKIDNQLTMDGNQNLLPRRLDRSFLSWFKNNFRSAKTDMNMDKNTPKMFQSKFFSKKNTNGTLQGIASNQTLPQFNSTLYDFSRRNTIKESLFEEYRKQMDVITNALLALDKRAYRNTDIFLRNNPLEMNKWLATKGSEYYTNDFDENIWKVLPPPVLTQYKRANRDLNTFIRNNPLEVNKWLSTKGGEYYKNVFDENIWKITPLPTLSLDKRTCRNVDTFLRSHPLEMNKWLSTKGGEYYKNDFDENIWKILPLPVPLPVPILHKRNNRRVSSFPQSHPSEMNQWLLTKGGEYYKKEFDENIWKAPPLPFLPPLSADKRKHRFRCNDCNKVNMDEYSPEALPDSRLYTRQVKAATPCTVVTNRAAYPNVLTRAVEISLNPSNNAHSGNLLANVAKKMNTSTLELAEKIVNSADVNSLALLNNANVNKMVDTYSSKTVITPKPIAANAPPLVNSSPTTPMPTPAVKQLPVNSNAAANSATPIPQQNSGILFVPNNPVANLTSVLDQVLTKLETIQQGKTCDDNEHGEGTPCDVTGSWSSQNFGLCFEIQLNGMKNRDVANSEKYKALTIEAQECTPPKQHNELDLEWKFGGGTQKETGGPFYMYAQKQAEHALATFIGFCRSCSETDTIFGSWTFLSPTKDCSDVLLSFNVKTDIMRRVRMEAKRREHYKNFLFHHQRDRYY